MGVKLILYCVFYIFLFREQVVSILYGGGKIIDVKVGVIWVVDGGIIVFVSNIGIQSNCFVIERGDIRCVEFLSNGVCVILFCYIVYYYGMLFEVIYSVLVIIFKCI